MKFVKCDVTSFESQLKMFKAAKEGAPSQTIDVVVACAGIAPNDTVFNVEGECPKSTEPIRRRAI